MVRPATIQLDGLCVAVTFKKIKHLRIRVHPPLGAVTASAPARMSQREVKRLLETKLPWIQASRQSFVDCMDLEVSGDLDQILVVWGVPIRAVECPAFRSEHAHDLQDVPVSRVPLSKATVSDISVSEAVVPEASVSEASVSEASVSEGALSKATSSEISLSEGVVAEGSVSSVPLSEGVVSGGVVAEAFVSEHVVFASGVLSARAVEMTTAQRQTAILRWQRELLKAKIEELLDKWQPIMGVTANEWRLRKMKTRWGSCNNTAKRLWFGTSLINRPVEQVEYVVVHELAHLIAPNHGRVFIETMDRFLPDWRERRKAINTVIRKQDFSEFAF